MSVIVVLSLVLAVVAALLAARKARRTQREINLADVRRPRVKASRPVGKTLRVGADCCAAATTTAELWFKDWEAPKLPLTACDRSEVCRCSWERNYDRRITERRVGGERRKLLRFGTTPDRRSGEERRVARKDDWKSGDVDL